MSTPQEQVEFKPAERQTPVAGANKENKSWVEVEPVEQQEEVVQPTEQAAQPPTNTGTPAPAPATATPTLPPGITPPPPPKPEGWDQVDFSEIQDPTLRGKIEARFNRLYGQVKAGERQWDTVRQYQERLEQQIAELKAGQQQVLANDDEKVISDLKAKFVEAYNKGEHEEVIKILGEINQKDLERRQKQQQPQKQTEQQTEQQTQPADAVDIPPAAKAEMRRWATDKPYAQPDHPLFNHTVQAMNHFLVQGAQQGKDLNWLLATTQAYMQGEYNKFETAKQGNGKQEPKIVSAVLPQQQGVSRQESKVDLSEEEKQVARKLFNRLPPAEAYKKYSAGKK